jgi:MFS family permease
VASTDDIAPSPSPRGDNPFRYRDFTVYWLSRVAAVFGSQIQGAAIGWQVYEIARRTHDVPQSALFLSFVGLAQFLPMVLFVLPAGEMADRLDRKKIFAACLAVDAVCAAAYFGLALHGSPPLWALFAIAALFGASRSFIAPASSALLPMLIPRQALPRGIVLSSLAFQSGAIAGPAIGGALAGFSAATAYGVAFAMFAIGTVVGLMVKGNTRPEPQIGSRWTLMKEGLSYVWRTRIVFGAISLDLVAVLLGGATLLMPVFAKDVLHVGAEGFGILRAAPAIGAAAVALYLARWPILRRGGPWMFWSVAVFGLSTVVFGLSQVFWVTVASLVVLGAADMISVNIRQTLIQIVTPDSMRGRVSAVSMLFISASNELGEFESGVVARILGPVGAAVFGGVGSLVATGLWAVWFPALRKADKLT